MNQVEPPFFCEAIEFAGTSPYLIWGHIRCMHARPHRRKKNMTFRQKNSIRFGKLFMSKRPVLSWFCFWFSTNWLGAVCRLPICRILELKKNDKTNNVGKMQSINRASDMSPFPLVPCGPLVAAYVPILLSEVEQEQIPSGKGDREAIVAGAGLCDGEGEHVYTGYAPHMIRNVSTNVFSLRYFGIFFLPKRPPPCFCRNVLNPSQIPQLQLSIPNTPTHLNCLNPNPIITRPN